MFKLLMFPKVFIIIETLVRLTNGYDGQHPDIRDSPRQFQTKYGTLRGVIIPLSRDSSGLSGSTSTTGGSGGTGSGGTQSRAGSTGSLTPVEAYFGVPYASPPVQTRRFMPPVTPSHWRGIRPAKQFGPVCPQPLPDIGNATEATKTLSSSRLEYLRRVMPFMRNQSEDCLYLNIYVPYNPSAGTTTTSTSGSSSSSASYSSSTTYSSIKYPVIVFISGESYDWDAGNPYDGSVLSSFGQVIVVTLNYRLGVLGFLPAVVDGAVRGNYGLMDQVAALHWIQENIGELSGDTHNVTVIGHGFGANCVHLLMISPMARGLFSRVVLMSGSALGPSAIARDADTYARHLAKAINCPNFDNVVMVDCLRQKTVDDILRVDLMTPQYLTAFGPIIDGIVVPSEPRQLMQSKTSDGSQQFPLNSMANINNIDLMFGVTRVESPFIFSSNEERHGIDLSRRERILRTLVRNLFDYHQQAILLTLINEYTDWNRPIEHPINLLDSTADILGDALVVAPIVETGDIHSKWTQQTTQPTSSAQTQQSQDIRHQKTFFYVFVYQSEDGNKMLHQRLGCLHGEELAYLFGAPLAVQYLGRSIGHFAANYSKPEVTLSEAVMTYWINFAKYGDPNIGHQDTDQNSQQAANDRGKGRFDNVQWPLYDVVQKKYLMIGMKPKLRDHYHSHRLSFWLHLIPHLHKPGDEDVYLRHHLLKDHENPNTYDGVVRQIAFKFLQPLPTPSFDPAFSSMPGTKRFTTMTSLLNKNINDDNSVLNHDSVGGVSVIDDTTIVDKNSTATALSTNGTETGYATALSVTIAIGCSLLILNMLIFAGVYYQLDRNAKNRAPDSTTTPKRANISIASAAGHNHLHHHHSTDDACLPEELSSLMLKTSSRQSSSPSPINVLTANLNLNDSYISNNTSSLRRGVQSTGYGKLQKLSLESVPEQTICSVPSHQCSIDYGLSDCQQELELNNIRVPVCVERNQIKI